MSWNYRVIQSVTEDKEEYYGIKEVYYNKQGGIKFWTQDYIDPSSDTLEGLINVLETMLKDCKRHPPLLETEGKLIPIIGKP